MAALPGGPFGPGRWPARGAFGAFTWVGWMISGGAGLAVGLASARSAGRVRGRAIRVALLFGLLAAVAYGAAAAAGAGLIERAPLAALAVAVVVALGFRRLLPS